MQNVSTYIRSIHSSGFASLMMWFFNTNLTLGFQPWIGKDQIGLDKYDRNKFLSTSIDHEKAAMLWLLATPIIEGRQNNQIYLEIPCNKQAKLIFKYRTDENNQMRAYLTIEKNGERITFKFRTQSAFVKENGRTVEMIIQTGLGVFVKTLEAYLTAVGADRHLSKLTDEQLGDPQLSANNLWM